MDIDYHGKFWDLWINSFGNKRFLDGLDAIRLQIIQMFLINQHSPKTKRGKFNYILLILKLLAENLFLTGWRKKFNIDTPETDILFISHTERSDIWPSMLKLVYAIHSISPDLRLTALIPSKLSECPDFVRRIDSESAESPNQKGLLKFKILSLVAFLRSTVALLVYPRDKELRHNILKTLPEILYTLLQVSFVIQFGRRLIQQIKPKAVVVSVDSSSPISCGAAIEKIPVLTIQHGIREVYYARFISDICYIWGKISRDCLLEWGAIPESLVEGGSLKVAAVENEIKESRRNAQRNESLKHLVELKSQGFKVFVFLSQGLTTSHFQGIEGAKYDIAFSWVIEAHKYLRGKYCFVIKLHPSERGPQAYIDRWGNDALDGIIFIDGKVRIFELLSIADVAAVVKSTSGLDTMLAGVPLIQLFSDEWTDITKWQQYGLHRCSSVKCLCQLLEELTLPERRKEALKVQEKILSFELSNRGREAEAIAEDIMQRIFKSNQL